MLEILFLILLNISVYYKTIWFDYIVDDLAWKEKREKEGFGRNIFLNIKERLYGGGTFARRIDGKYPFNSKIEHAFTIFLHTIACVLIYIAFGKDNISFCAALLYSINPVNNQTAIWLNGRRYLINIIIVLSMLILGAWGIFLYPLTGVFQVTAIFSPLLLGWAGVLVIPLFALFFSKEIIKKIQIRLKHIHFEGHNSLKFYNNLIQITKIYGQSFFKMIYCPRPLGNSSFMQFWGVTEEGTKDSKKINASFLIGILAIVLSISGLLLFKDNLFWYWLFMILATLQWCAVLPVTQWLADRYVSLPNVFMMFFLSYLSHLVFGIYGYAVIGLFVGLYYATLKTTFRMYEDIYKYSEYHLFYNPECMKPYEFHATRLLFKDKDPISAMEVVKKGLDINPTDMKLNLLAAQIMRFLGDSNGVFYYLKVARENSYINQDKLIKLVERGIFGVDVDKAMEEIKQKKSKLNTAERENIIRIYDGLRQ